MESCKAVACKRKASRRGFCTPCWRHISGGTKKLLALVNPEGAAVGWAVLVATARAEIAIRTRTLEPQVAIAEAAALLTAHRAEVGPRDMPILQALYPKLTRADLEPLPPEPPKPTILDYLFGTIVLKILPRKPPAKPEAPKPPLEPLDSASG